MQDFRKWYQDEFLSQDKTIIERYKCEKILDSYLQNKKQERIKPLRN